ncbi:glutathione synthase [Thauera chlorobenzoica]|uniref:Glutathione synthetase n=1 Tax=Thauera chlorobenzoica TaxID=96773 RepID=A0A1H5T7N3_9RHOO|nr:glutathione synthase [Thauera chlorobenzoica]APR04206.1 Glutathione synthetase [Thauera chlorobenzoica]SEF58168.1 glutathione synthase [Thauera chlorobenzoica]
MSRPLKLVFILDPLDGLQAYKDSSIAMMRAAARRGHQVWALQRAGLTWREGGVVGTACVPLSLHDDDRDWYRTGAAEARPLAAFDAVLMRQDPPFDFEYVTATWLLERAVQAGVRVFNDPRAVRDHSEKIAITEFPQFTATTLVARDPADIHAFIDELGDVILKPLDGMGGSQIFRVRADDPNRNVIVETLAQDGTRTIMAQRYLPQIVDGDKRVLIIGGEVVPYALARIPKAGETRGNLAAGGRGVAMALTAREREIAEFLAPILWARGLLIVGLDVIGGHLTEINVTSPTCMVEIAAQQGFDVAARVIEALEQACG